MALLASSIPNAMLVAALTAGYYDVIDTPAVADALRGAVAASVALILASAWALVGPQLVAGKRIRTLMLLVLCWTAYDVLHFSALAVLVMAGAVGGLWVER
jgi:chromate transport protein ChrA